MIPRQAPTYTWTDLAVAWRLASSGADAFGMLTRWFQQTYGRKHVLYFNRAQTGTFRLLREVAAGREVVMPAYTCIVVPEAALWAKCRVRFADIDLRDLNMNVPELAAALTPETHAIIATHQFGIPCEIEEMAKLAQQRGLYVLEDAAPALGARWNGRLVGTWGHACVFSFDDTKVVAAGGGGVMLLDDSQVAGRVSVGRPARWERWDLTHALKCVRSKLQCTRTTYGTGLRLFLMRQGWPTSDRGQIRHAPVSISEPRWTRFGAALALVQLPRLGSNLSRRTGTANEYRACLLGQKGMQVLTAASGADPAWVRYPVRVADKFAFWQGMVSRGVDLSWSFDYHCARVGGPPCPNAELVSRSSINLPLVPALRGRDVSAVTGAVCEVLACRAV